MTTQRKRQFSIEHSLHINAAPALVWRHVTAVDFTAFQHPLYFAVLGIPKPLRAEISRPGPGGVRTACFSNGLRFAQEIIEWQPHERYAFTFRADPGFRVAYLLDLANGPFRLIAGAYRLAPVDGGVLLTLSSQYELAGIAGRFLRLPVRLVLDLFQRYLLRGIKANAERAASAP